jgi:flagellar FliJ protein
MFKFKFEKALEHKIKEEKKAQENFLKRKSEKEHEEQRLIEIDNEIIRLLSEYEETKKGRLDINLMLSYEKFIKAVKTKRIEQLELIDAATIRMTKAQDVFIELRKERKIFEKLKEKQKEAYEKEELKKEQKLIDELSNNMYNRRR